MIVKHEMLLEGVSCDDCGVVLYGVRCEKVTSVRYLLKAETLHARTCIGRINSILWDKHISKKQRKECIKH